MAPIKVLASQAQSINLYKNIRIKVMKCCTNIYFNRQCLIKKVVPKYANIHVNIPYTSPTTNITQKRYKQSDLKMKSNDYIRKNKTRIFNTDYQYMLCLLTD